VPDPDVTLLLPHHHVITVTFTLPCYVTPPRALRYRAVTRLIRCVPFVTACRYLRLIIVLLLHCYCLTTRCSLPFYPLRLPHRLRTLSLRYRIARHVSLPLISRYGAVAARPACTLFVTCRSRVTCAFLFRYRCYRSLTVRCFVRTLLVALLL